MCAASLLIAVTKMIGVSREGLSCLITRAVSNPSMPGICTSRRITAYVRSKRRATASLPDDALTIS